MMSSESITQTAGATGGYDLPALVEAQRSYFRNGNTLPIEFRRKRLRGLERILMDRTEDLLDALESDLGKPRLEAYLSEVYFTILELRLFIRKLPRWSRPRRAGHPLFLQPSRSVIRREPYGTSLVVSPWNYPIQLALSPAIAAIAAGNTVVLKPSELAPASAKLLGEMIAEAFNPQHVAVVQGGPEIGSALLDLPFDKWFYTGNERIGRLYAEAAAKRLAPITLELGGKCPSLVLDDAPVDRSIERIVGHKFFNAGQTCIAPDFLLVPEARRAEFVEAAKERLERWYGGVERPDLSTIVNREHYDRLLDLCEGDAVIRIGEDRPEDLFLAPRILPEATWESRSMEEEIFGPVLPVIGYRDLDEAIEQIASRPEPLALYAFSRSSAERERLLDATRSGTVCLNDAFKQALNPNLPFGGVGPSGMGRYRGRAGFENFTYERAVTRRWFWKDLFVATPPYDRHYRIIRKVMK